MNYLFLKPEQEPEFHVSDNKIYKVEAIRVSAFYVKERKKYLPGLYYLIS